VSAGRVLILSADPFFLALVTACLAGTDFEIIGCPPFTAECPSMDIIVADVDSLPSSLDSRLSQLRRLDASIGLTLVTARWPNLSRLHALRPCGYVRRPFSAHDLIRVMHDLMSGVQVAHRQTGDTDGCSPVARSYCDRERPATESAA